MSVIHVRHMREVGASCNRRIMEVLESIYQSYLVFAIQLIVVSCLSRVLATID